MHTHTDTDTLTWGCPACILRVHRDQRHAELNTLDTDTLMARWRQASMTADLVVEQVAANILQGRGCLLM